MSKLGHDWVLNHVGMTVENRNATLRHYQSLGIGVSVGPQPLLPHEDGEGSLMYYRTLGGDPVANTYQTGGVHNFTDGECQIGDCQLECFPMRPGEGMFLNEYLAKKGPGINHICFNAPGVEEETELLVSRGCDVMFNALVNGKIVENYLDSRDRGDLMISLRPPASDWENTWKANNAAHPLVNDWRFLGVGVVVNSVDDAVAYYASLGFEAADEPNNDDLFAMRRQCVQVGPLTFEFCESLADDSYCGTAQSRRGEGVFDLRFEVNDIDAETRRLGERGVQIYAQNAVRQIAAFDTRAEGNMLLRLMQA